MKKNLQSLIDISNSIENIYNTLTLAEINTNKELYNEYMEYLKIATEVEDELYDKLNVNKYNIEKYALYALEESSQQSNAATRIEIHLKQMLYKNPFVSTEEDYQIAEEENSYIIENQFCNDYTINVLKNIESTILKTSNSYKKSELIKIKNNILYNNKMLDYILSKNKDIKTNGREKCIIFNHNKIQTKNVYLNLLNEEINSSLINIVNLTNEILKNSKSQRLMQLLELIYLKSALEILTDEEKKEFDEHFSKFEDKNKIVLTKTSSNGYKKILNLLNTTKIR